MKFKLSYFVIPAFAIVTLTLARYFSAQGMFWYYQLNMPWFVPPNWLFSLVWTTIYALTTAAAVIIWNRFLHIRSFFIVMMLFVLNALSNVLWNYFFFIQHNIVLAFATTFVVEASVLLLMAFIWPHARSITLLLLPYALWVAFAIWMNYVIWIMN